MNFAFNFYYQTLFSLSHIIRYGNQAAKEMQMERLIEFLLIQCHFTHVSLSPHSERVSRTLSICRMQFKKALSLLL